MERVFDQLSSLNENMSIISKRLNEIDATFNWRFAKIECRVADIDGIIAKMKDKGSNISDGIVSKMHGQYVNMNNNKESIEEEIINSDKLPASIESHDIRRGALEKIDSTMNKRFLSLERAVDEKNRYLKSMDRRIVILENATNESTVNIAFDNASIDNIGLREIASTSRGESEF